MKSSKQWKKLLSDICVSGEWEGIGHCALGYPKAAKRKNSRVYWGE